MGKHFDQSSKLSYVNRWIAGETIGSLAREAGVSSQAIRNWKRDLVPDAAPPAGANGEAAPEITENATNPDEARASEAYSEASGEKEKGAPAPAPTPPPAVSDHDLILGILKLLRFASRKAVDTVAKGEGITLTEGEKQQIDYDADEIEILMIFGVPAAPYLRTATDALSPKTAAIIFGVGAVGLMVMKIIGTVDDAKKRREPAHSVK